MKSQVVYSLFFICFCFLGCKKNKHAPDTSIGLPVLDTLILDIHQETAGVDSRLISEGNSSITAQGVCWSKTSDPTIIDNKVDLGVIRTGAFSVGITNLTPNTTYYARAYATNASGTSYSSEKSFKTIEKTIKDIDGNVYNVIERGFNFWTTENLKTTRYRNGDKILTGINNKDWSNLTKGAYAIYDNNLENSKIYGNLYNYFAVVDSRGICPVGYHIAWQEDIYNFIESASYLDPVGSSGYAMKSTSFWQLPNSNTNSSGFNAIPAGFRNGSTGYFLMKGESADFWSSENTYYLAINDGPTSILFQYGRGWDPTNGYSCRCVRNKN